MAEKVWTIDTPETSNKETTRVHTRPRPYPRRKLNPGIAISLSLFFGGMGQFYNGQKKLGVFYFLITLSVYVITAFILINWKTIDNSLQSIVFNHYHFAILYWTLLFLGAGAWAAGAVQAYMKAVHSRYEGYTGTTSRFFPAFCSFFVPGWGQFLNGQTKKGVFLLAITTVSFLGAVTTIIVILLWENFHSVADRLFWERVLMISLLPILWTPLLWTIGFYDALVVSLDEVKKESLKNRLEYANNRRRIKGWRIAVANPILITMILGATLALVGFFGYQYFPRDFYLNTLQSVKVELERKNLVIIPKWISRGQSFIASM